MFEDLKDKTVKIHFAVLSGLTDTVKGKVIQVENSWLKLQIKDNLEFINLQKVSRISVLD